MLDLFRDHHYIRRAVLLTCSIGSAGGAVAGALAGYSPSSDGWGVGVAVSFTYLMLGGTVLIREGFRAEAAHWAARVSSGAINVMVQDDKIYPVDNNDNPIKNEATVSLAPAVQHKVIRNLVDPAIPTGYAVNEIKQVADAAIFDDDKFTLETWVGKSGERKPFTRRRWTDLRTFFYTHGLAEDKGRGEKTGMVWTDRGISWLNDIHSRYGPALHRA